MIRTRNTFAVIYRWHQRLGLAMLLAVFAWALSGLSHPLISRLNPQPAQMMPPSTVLDTSHIAPVGELLASTQTHLVRQLRLFQWQDKPVYRLHSENGVSYHDARTLTPIPGGESAYAEYLARYFLADQDSHIQQVQPLDHFDRDYLYINRYLPVMRVDFARQDGMRAYVDTEQGRLATLVDNRKAWTGRFFRTFHSWAWIPNLTVRRSLMSLFLITGLATAGFGLWIYWQSWRKGIYRTSSPHVQAPPRRLHRTLGLVVSIPVLAFCSSGLLHLWVTPKSDQPQSRLEYATNAEHVYLHPQSLPTTGPSGHALTAIELAQLDGMPVWRLVPARNQTGGDHHHHHHGNHQHTPRQIPDVLYLNASDARPLTSGWALHARDLALTFSGYTADSLVSIEPVVDFSRHEYGFINKRLPVHAVTFNQPGNPTLYVETATATLAASVSTSDRFEGYTFGWLHKWQLFSMSRDLRDLLQSLTAGLILLVLVLGALRFFQRKR